MKEAMSRFTTTLALLRVPRGAPRPGSEAFRAALASDRKQLSLPPAAGAVEIEVAGPYPVTGAGADLDEYVVWEY